MKKYERYKLLAVALVCATIVTIWGMVGYTGVVQEYNAGALTVPEWSEPLLHHHIAGIVLYGFALALLILAICWTWLGKVFVNFRKAKTVSSRMLDGIIRLSAGREELFDRARKNGVVVTPSTCKISLNVLERVSVQSLCRLVYQLLYLQLDDVARSLRFAREDDETVFHEIARQLLRMHKDDAKKFVRLMRNHHELFGLALESAFKSVQLQQQIDTLQEQQRECALNTETVFSDLARQANEQTVAPISTMPIAEIPQQNTAPAAA